MGCKDFVKESCSHLQGERHGVRTTAKNKLAALAALPMVAGVPATYDGTPVATRPSGVSNMSIAAGLHVALLVTHRLLPCMCRHATLTLMARVIACYVCSTAFSTCGVLLTMQTVAAKEP